MKSEPKMLVPLSSAQLQQLKKKELRGICDFYGIQISSWYAKEDVFNQLRKEYIKQAIEAKQCLTESRTITLQALEDVEVPEERTVKIGDVEVVVRRSSFGKGMLDVLYVRTKTECNAMVMHIVIDGDSKSCYGQDSVSFYQVPKTPLSIVLTKKQ